MTADTKLAPCPTDLELADAIEAACRGRKEWQVMNADETALCMWFTHEDHSRPAHAAQKWLDEHPSKKAEGYHVVERHLHSKLETLALDAAKRLRAQAAPQGPALVQLTAAQMAAGREAIFSTDNPYCPCDSRTFRKVAEWVERHHGITGAPNDKPATDALDAARYRHLRAQHWNDGVMCVVLNPRDAVKLGRDCPSESRLDELVDADIKLQGMKP